MPKILYVDKKFGADALKAIDQANTIIAEYQSQGYELTLRQLYYQHVARGFIANNMREYKKLGDLISDGRLAGLIDWNSIVDRTRSLDAPTHWDSPESIISAVAQQYRRNKWETQKNQVEIWIEKQALEGIFDRACKLEDVPYLSCRGYTSQSEMWKGGQRLLGYFAKGQDVTILHFGDHDPSGIDMSRDIEDRLKMFIGKEVSSDELESKFHIHRIALNMDQIEQYNPPPNPCKITDSRAKGYIQRFGGESWELDALDPRTLENLVRAEIAKLRDSELWDEVVAEEKKEREQLKKVSLKWESVVKFIK